VGNIKITMNKQLSELARQMGKESAKVRFKGKTKKQRTEIMRELAKKRWDLTKKIKVAV
jgi:hypothetical protein